MLLSWATFTVLSGLLYAPSTFAIPANVRNIDERAATPSVVLDQGTFIGDATTTFGVDRFLGIPFAQRKLHLKISVPSYLYLSLITLSLLLAP